MLPSRNEIVTEVILWREHAFVLSHQLQLGSTGIPCWRCGLAKMFVTLIGTTPACGGFEPSIWQFLLSACLGKGRDLARLPHRSDLRRDATRPPIRRATICDAPGQRSRSPRWSPPLERYRAMAS